MQLQIGTGAFGPSIFKARRKKFGVGSLLILLILGAVFVTAGLIFLNLTKINPSWKRVEGTVVGAANENGGNSGTTYAPIVSYRANGQTYRVTGTSSSSSYPRVGNDSQVAYDPANPQDAKVVTSGGTKALILIFPAVGVLMLVLGPVLFVRSLLRTEDIDKLKQTGQKVRGVITDIQSQPNGNQGGTSYRLAVSATGLDGTVQNYLSDWLQGIGGLAMTDFRNNPVPMDVYLDPANLQNYYVDISEVPNLTPERIMELVRSAAHGQLTPLLSPGQVPMRPSMSQPTTPRPQPDQTVNQHQTPPTV